MGIDSYNVCLSDRDLYREWIDQRTHYVPGAKLIVSDAFDDWEEFVAAKGELTPGSKQAFGRALSANRLRVSHARCGKMVCRVYNDLALEGGQASNG